MANLENINLHINAKNKAKGVLNSVKKQILTIGAAYLGWKAATTILSSSIKAAIETEKVYNDLSASIKRHGGVWEDVEDSLRSYTDTMQKATGVSDEFIAKGLQSFIDFGATTADAMDTMNVALDLAAGSGIELRAAVDLLSKAQVGYTGTLSRYGIIIDEAIPANEKFAAAIEQINQKFGGAAAARMETTAGKIDLLTETWGDLQEKFGEVLVESDLLTDSLTGLTEMLDSMVEIMKSNVSVWEFLKEKFDFMLHGQSQMAIAFGETTEAARQLAKHGLLVAHGATVDTTNATNELGGALDDTRSKIDEYVSGWNMVEGKLVEVKQTFIDVASAQEGFLEASFNIQDEYSHGWVVANEQVADAFDEYAVTAIAASGEVVERVTKDVVTMTAEATASFETFGMEVERIMQESLVNSTLSATTQMINSLRLLSTESTGFFKQMGVAFVNEFIRRAMTALITSGLLRIFGAILSGGTSEIGNIAGGFTGGGLAPPVIGGGTDFGGGTESLQFSINSRQTNITQDDRNLTGRSLVQFR